MDDIDKINIWMRDKKLSQVALARLLHCSNVNLSRVLSRAQSLSPQLRARIFELMEGSHAPEERPYEVNFSDEQEERLRQLAHTAGVAFEAFLQGLVTSLLHAETETELRAADEEEQP